jgi:hypothetical protein
MRLSRPPMLGLAPSALAIRAATVGVVAVVAVAVAMAEDRAGVDLLCAAAAGAGIVAALAPRGPWATLCLGLLVSAYAVSSLGGLRFGEITRTMSLAAALWAIHSGYALAAVVPARARANISLIIRWIRRSCLVLAISLPVATIAAWLGRHTPAWTWLRILGVAALLLVAASPLVLAIRSDNGEQS